MGKVAELLRVPACSGRLRMPEQPGQMLRLYEREGLLRPSRSDGNTRLYTDDDLERLEVIRS